MRISLVEHYSVDTVASGLVDQLDFGIVAVIHYLPPVQLRDGHRLTYLVHEKTQVLAWPDASSDKRALHHQIGLR